MVLPERKQIVPLIGRGERLLMFERAPMRFGSRQIVENLDARDLAIARRVYPIAAGKGTHGYVHQNLSPAAPVPLAIN